MSTQEEVLRDRFRGCMLGLAIADALGGKVEGQRAEAIRERFSDFAAFLANPKEEIWYTDDTQMAIGVAEALADHGEIIEEHLCAAFVANYIPSRGYGRGARAVLGAMEDGLDYKKVAQEHFPGGSFGNGAAMRVAPVGLFFCRDRVRLLDQARQSSLPTHIHRHGIEGAQLVALAVAHSVNSTRFDRQTYYNELLSACQTEEYRSKLELAATITERSRLHELGNGIAALESAVTAIACFALAPDSYEDTICSAIFLGGDTDTIAAMAGAISGAYLGVDKLPNRLLRLLESSLKGGSYIASLSDRLFEKHRQTC